MERDPRAKRWIEQQPWRRFSMERKDSEPGSVNAPPTATSITIFAVVVALLFGGMYLFFPESYRPTASNQSPTVAETPGANVEPPATTGQGGSAK
jgi:hypothetical protein